MAKVKIQGHASGTGILTVTAPNTSTDRTITLPDATGTLLNSDGDGSNLTGINAIDGTDLTIVTGDIVFGTAGKGICLGVTSNTDGNTLDDYEEGTWTPSLDATGDSISVSYTSNTGNYTKIGNSVHITFRLRVSSHSGGSGEYRVNGLPFTSSNPGGDHIGISTMAWENHPITSGKEFQQILDSGQTYIRLKQASWENYTPDSNCSIYMSFHYTTS
jgi:hypothetical protein|tara:strand:+ start:76 stop:726 length:651 start_codon:yes stop_codon:yes gene_type:complete